MECGPQAVAGIDRCAVVRGAERRAGQKTTIDGAGELGFLWVVGVRC